MTVSDPGVTSGYWNNPEATSELIKDGWPRTGDMGKKDRLGRLYFMDRKKDVIKCGGYSVFSMEVEKELLEHPAVAGVAVVGASHPLKNQVPLAVVTLEAGAEAGEGEMLTWCRDNIAGYKSPRAIRVIPPEEMPYSMTLKVRKLELGRRFGDIFERDAQGD